MPRSETVTLTNMCMVYDNQGNILVEDRLDPSWPGMCFPGGHVEPGESFTRAVIREVWEETGLTIEKPRLCGLKQFPRKDGTRYIVMRYKTNQFSGDLRSSREGRVFCLPRAELGKYKLPVSFDQTLRIFEEDELVEHYCHWDGGVYRRTLL